MGNIDYYEVGAATARRIFTKQAVVGAVLGALKAREIDKKDPKYVAGALLGHVGEMVGAPVGAVGGGLAGGLAGGVVGIPLSLLLKDKKLLHTAAGAGALVGAISGGVGGAIYGSRKLTEEVLTPTKKRK